MLLRHVYHALKAPWKLVTRQWYTLIVTLQAKSVGRNLRVNFKTSVSGKTVLGNHVNFNGATISGGGDVVIGDYFHSGSGLLIMSAHHNYKGDKIPYDETFIVKPIIIKDNVWIGSRVIVLAGVTIGEGAIIQAGSVVVSDIPDCAIAGGHPAKVFAWRNKERYYELKEQGKML